VGGLRRLVDLLIARGAPVDIVDPTYDATPLGFAIHDCLVAKRHPEGEFGRVAKSLIEAGSPWDALDYPTGDARLDDVFMEYLPHRIDGAAILGDEPLVLRLLGEHPSTDDLALALAGAAKGGHVALCRNLMSRGAGVNTVAGRDRSTPLIHALRGSTAPASGEIVRMLIDAGADVGIRNCYGTLALHAAVGGGASLETIRLLLRSGASAHIDIKNQFDFTPASIAVEKGRHDVVALFRE
jgi:ankyrin repeat protein